MRAEPTEIENAASQAARVHGDDPAALIEILHDIQEALGCVPEPALPVLADRLNRSRAEIHGVVSFYHDFRKAPAAGAHVRLCGGEACQAMGGKALADHLEGRKGVTVETVYCLGACACAPAATVNGALRARLDAQGLDALIAKAR
jgi:formate dehydrogenase subunit gamma